MWETAPLLEIPRETLQRFYDVVCMLRVHVVCFALHNFIKFSRLGLLPSFALHV